MSTNHTQNYSLSQWVPSDPVIMSDFNADNEKLDAALHALAEKQAAAPRVAVGSYTGTGGTGAGSPNTLDFTATLGRPPMLVLVRGMRDAGSGLIFVQGATGTSSSATGTSGYDCTVTWSGNRLSWYAGTAQGQCNSQGAYYRYFAIG